VIGARLESRERETGMYSKFHTSPMAWLSLALAIALTACNPAEPGSPSATATIAPTEPAAVSTPAPAAAPTETPQPVPPTAVPAQGIDACAIFPQAEVEALVGDALQPAEPPVSGAGIGVVTSCAYQVAGDPARLAMLIVRQLDDVEFSARFFEQTKQRETEALQVTPEDVPGLGDSAYWIGDLYNQLNVRKGNVHLLFSIDGQTGPNEGLKQFAQAVLDRLP